MTESRFLLDDETEQALTGHDTVKVLPLGEAIRRADSYDAGEDALRSRIRFLIEEARKAGEESVYKTTGNMVTRNVR